MRPYLLLALLLWSTLTLDAQMGFPVKEFGKNGKVFTSFNTINEYGRTVLPLPDGKTVIAMYAGNRALMTRHLANGDIDKTFGTNGVSDAVPLSLEVASAILQSDGGILVYGTSIPPEQFFFIAKYLPSGRLDQNFGYGGFIRLNYMPYKLSGPYGPVSSRRPMAVTKDNKIIFCGITIIDGLEKFFLYRLLPNGTPDNSFGENGFVTYDNERFRLGRCELALQENGDIIIGGFSKDFMDAWFMLGKFFPDGSPDLSFGGGPGRANIPGWSHTSIFNRNDILAAITIQPDGKIVQVGTSFTPRSQQLVIVRHLPNGELDQSFGNAGRASINYKNPNGSSSMDQLLTLGATDVLIQPDGKILVGGSLETYGATLWRFTENGRLDKSFYGTGMLNFNKTSSVADLANGPGGKVVVTGAAEDENAETADYLFARLLPNGDPDYSLGGASFVLGTSIKSQSVYHTVAVQPDGKILAAGEIYLDSKTVIIARYNQDGSLDPTFGTNGKKIFINNTSFNFLFSYLELYTDGRILIAVSAIDTHLLYRLLPNGDFDRTFDEDGVMGELRGFGGSYLPQSISKVLILPNEKIMVIGSETMGTGIHIRTFLSNGKLESGAGIKEGLYMDPLGAALLSNGKILIGSVVSDGLGNTNYATTRLNSNYTRDITFGTNGTQLINFGSPIFQRRMKQMQSGRSILSGQISYGHPDNYDLAMAMVNSDGTPNTAFGDNGKLVTDLDKAFAPNPIYYEVSSVEEQNDGKLLITGFFENGAVYQHGVGRLNADGTLDPTFGTGGFYVDTVSEVAPFGYWSNVVNQTITAVSGNRLYIVGTTKDRSKAVLAAYQIDDQSLLQASKNKLKTTPEIKGSVQVLNNPAPDAFTLVLSLKKSGPVQVRILDASGKVVDNWQRLAPSGNLRFGSSYRPGTYLAEVTQGGEKTVIKLVKQ